MAQDQRQGYPHQLKGEKLFDFFWACGLQAKGNPPQIRLSKNDFPNLPVPDGEDLVITKTGGSSPMSMLKGVSLTTVSSSFGNDKKDNQGAALKPMSSQNVKRSQPTVKQQKDQIGGAANEQQKDNTKNDKHVKQPVSQPKSPVNRPSPNSSLVTNRAKINSISSLKPNQVKDQVFKAVKSLENLAKSHDNELISKRK